jgi:SHS2 domain-containing protein
MRNASDRVCVTALSGGITDGELSVILRSMDKRKAGFREIEHTADWALQVWAPDLETLFRQAAKGMYALAETELSSADGSSREVNLEASDAESMLVAFLGELLFFAENEGLGFEKIQVSISGKNLTASMEGSEILSRKKEIKAVTYHNLKVAAEPDGYSVTIVFDV